MPGPASPTSAALADGKVRTVSGFDDGSIRIVHPFSAPGMNTTWAVVVEVPRAVFVDPIYASLLETLISGSPCWPRPWRVDPRRATW